MKRITIKEVASQAGVSTAAVSYVLNGKEGKVSVETIEKIRKAIHDLNYIPDYSARSLASNKSNLIGVVIPQTEDQSQLLLENPFYSDLISGVEATLRKKGYHMMLSGVDKGEGYLNVSMQRNLDGAIIMGIYEESFYEDLKKVNIPIVLVDSYIHDNHFKKVLIDDEYGGYLATRHLIECGHTNIGLVTGSIRTDGVVERRFLGYKRALREFNFFYNPDFVFEGNVSYDYGLEAGHAIARLPDRKITAVFAISDLMAYGVIQGLGDHGLRVPDDISVIGFDDVSISKFFIPRLTTIKQDITNRGMLAAQYLIDWIEGISDKKDDVIELPVELVERDSVKKINMPDALL